MKKLVVITVLFVVLLMGIGSGHPRKVGHQLFNIESSLREIVANKDFADQALEIERAFKACAKSCQG